MKYRKAGMGGTFDRFHTGHEQFIEFASKTADHLMIGITVPELLSKKLYAQTIESYTIRENSVKDFCEKSTISYEVFPLTDVYGPTLTDPEIDVIIATESTNYGADLINTERMKRHLAPLPIEKAPLSYDKDSLVISSERIRAGEINRAGFIYASIFNSDILLSQEQRDFFTQPQDNIITFPSESALTCLVGDTTIETFIQNNWKYEYACFDYLKKRSLYSPILIPSENTDICTWNNPGFISLALVETLRHAFQEKMKHIFINGEEDLAAVAAILLLPLGSHVYYGQPDVGMVKVIVTEEKKEQVADILTKK